MLAQARWGRHAEASETAGNLLKLASGLRKGHPLFDRKANWLLQAACGFALCGDAVPPDQADRRRDYLTRSLEALRLAVAAGYVDVATLETDPDLAPLRGETDFQSLVRGVKARKP
jgi:hypothetical protein